MRNLETFNIPDTKDEMKSLQKLNGDLDMQKLYGCLGHDYMGGKPPKPP